MKDSEILQELISLAFDNDPAPTNVTLRQSLDLLARTIIAENDGCSHVELAAHPHALFANPQPATPESASATPPRKWHTTHNPVRPRRR